METVAVAYRSCWFWGSIGWESVSSYPTTRQVQVIAIKADGSTQIHATLDYQVFEFGANWYGYDGNTPLSPPELDLPVGNGPLKCLVATDSGYYYLIFASVPDDVAPEDLSIFKNGQGEWVVQRTVYDYANNTSSTTTYPVSNAVQIVFPGNYQCSQVGGYTVQPTIVIRPLRGATAFWSNKTGVVEVL